MTLLQMGAGPQFLAIAPAANRRGAEHHALLPGRRELQSRSRAGVAAYSPEARGRSERMFGTLQGRLPKDLRLAGITTVEAANAWLKAHYLAEHNASVCDQGRTGRHRIRGRPAPGLARGAVRDRGANRRQRQHDRMERPAAAAARCLERPSPQPSPRTRGRGAAQRRVRGRRSSSPPIPSCRPASPTSSCSTATASSTTTATSSSSRPTNGGRFPGASRRSRGSITPAIASSSRPTSRASDAACSISRR